MHCVFAPQLSQREVEGAVSPGSVNPALNLALGDRECWKRPQMPQPQSPAAL